MKRVWLLLTLLALAGAAALWGWAQWSQKPVEPLDERFCGTFVLYRFEPPEGVAMASPFPEGQTRRFVLRPDGSYLLSIRVSGDYEMLRREGTVRVERGLLTFYQVSENRNEKRTEPESYGTRWGQDEEGEFLELRHTLEDYHLFLRRTAGKP